MSIVLLEDTRQQDKKHDLKHEYFEKNEIKVHRTKLYVGDYTLPTNQSICIDTKKDIQELIGDICGKSHTRFREELIRAQESGIQLIILVENTGGEIGHSGVYNTTIRRLDELHKWKNPRLFIMKNCDEVIGQYKNGRPKYKRVQKYPNATKGASLMKACMTMENKYGVKFLFCRPEESGIRIVEILTGGGADG